MLKFPSGWAAADVASSASAATSTLAPIALVRNWLLLAMGHLHAAGRPPPERRERLPGDVGVAHVKVWVSGQRAGQILPRLITLAERCMDQAGVKIQPGVPGSELQRFADRCPGFRGSAILDEGPGQQVVGVDIAPHAQLALRQLERPREIDVVVGVEVRQLAAVENLVQRVEMADVFDEVVLL